MRTIKLSSSLVLITILAGFCTAVLAQTPTDAQPRFLSLSPTDGLPIIPVFEGWVANQDGTISYSFGAVNRSDTSIDVPLGDDNYIEPARYDGIQPTHFSPGRSTGIFSITVTESESENLILWNLKTGDSEYLRVASNRATAYELDFIRPRPEGSLQPLVGFGVNGAQELGLYALEAEYPGGIVMTGEPVELIVNVRDRAERDITDTRFSEGPLPINATWYKHQGLGEVTFARHEDTEIPKNPYDEDDQRYSNWKEPGLNEVLISGPSGIGRIYATFSEPGNYIIRTKVDSHQAPDSKDNDQCCWTNVFQRFTVR